MPVSEVLRAEIEATIERLNRKRFDPDPIAGENYSRIASIVSSAYKRHGRILEQAILERLSECPNFDVWNDPVLQVPANADLLANGALADPGTIFGNEVNYGQGVRTLQVDVIVFDRANHRLRSYEIKRGFGAHDSGKRRSILRDTLCLQLLLRSYGASRGLNVVEARSHVIFYYGRRSIPAPFGIVGAEIDDHFGWPVWEAVEEVNRYFQERLIAILGG